MQRSPKVKNPDRKRLFEIYQRLYESYGPQGWWPAKTPLEMILGAILTQNTSWNNVEKAMEALRREKLISVRALTRIRHARLARAIRSAGFFNVKATRIQGFIQYLTESHGGQLSRLLSLPVATLRTELLAITGIGPETADSIILYAAKKPVFVVDAYTRRIFYRLGILRGQEDYDEIRCLFEASLPRKASLFNEYHAVIVKHAKERCRKRLLCEICHLSPICLKRF